ncbi:MAG: hypothetical protein RLQ25_02995 [Alphaproteobacteria bacterium]
MAKGLIAEFYMDAVHMKHESEQEGRPIFKDFEFIKIIPIGDNKTVVTKRVTEAERQKFPEEYAVFKKGVEQTFSGTPLMQWPAILPAQIKLLNHFNVYTVDQLAELNDIAISKIGPGTRELVEKAKAYLAKAANTADAQRFAAENERMKDDMARMSRTIEELSQRLEEKSDTPKRGPGRPRKEEAEAA